MSNRKIRVVPDINEIASEAAEAISSASSEAIGRTGKFSIALSGGNTPKVLFELLASDDYAKRIDFTRWEVYWGDERCVPPTHKDSNFLMASKALLDHVPIPAEQIFRMKGEIEPQESAKQYGLLLKEKFGDGGLDVILLGMGDDGHTASLFPGTTALDETEHRCVANYVEKMNTWRITMSAPFINKAHLIIMMVGGASKAARVVEVLEGPADTHRLPSQMIEPVDGEYLWIMDVAAAGMNESD